MQQLQSPASSFTLANGVKMPCLGLGVFQVPDQQQAAQSVNWALQAGYRHIDTAAIYQNEEGVGQGLRDAGLPREEVFVTTKVWNADFGYDSTLKAYDESLRKLGLDYVDLYLVHWPVKGKYKDTWKALETLYKEGRVRAIGVSNFLVHQLQDLLQDANIVPMVNQVEFHPYLRQPELMDFCAQKGIQMEAWAPLMQGRFTEEPLLSTLAQKYGRTPAQILLRWDLQHGVVTIPKSVREARIRENAQVFDFALSAEDMSLLDALDKGERIGPDPDNFDF